MKLFDYILVAIIALFVIATIVVLLALHAHSTEVEGPRVCRTESGHKKVECP